MSCLPVIWSSRVLNSHVGYEQLQPRLEALMQAQDEDLAHAAALESRITSIMDRHATQVSNALAQSATVCDNAWQIDALSELFVAWDDTLTDAEDKVSKMERERAERNRLGLE